MTEHEQPNDDPQQQPPDDQAEMFSNLGKKIDEIPAVQAAEQAMRRAAAELRRAEQRYQQARTDAASRVQSLRDSNVGDLVDGTLDCVRKHPGPGLIVAAFVGFFLGRLFRR